jgi:7-dehydrocholesterol reductase
MDIAHDRAGYYICWGCLVWVPAIYTSPALYLVEHPAHWPLPLAAAVFLAGITSIYVNYAADQQRQARPFADSAPCAPLR